jgi:hypothetical protein
MLMGMLRIKPANHFVEQYHEAELLFHRGGSYFEQVL